MEDINIHGAGVNPNADSAGGWLDTVLGEAVG